MIKQIPGFPDHYADELGNIYSNTPMNRNTMKRRWIKMKIRVNTRLKHRYIRLWHNGHGTMQCVGVFILMAFTGGKPNGMYCLHGNKGTLNDSLKNLRWGTQKENMADKYRDGTQQTGEKHPNHVLNELQVRIIRRLHELSMGCHKCKGIRLRHWQIAEIFGVDRTTVSLILKRKSWSHI